MRTITRTVKKDKNSEKVFYDVKVPETMIEAKTLWSMDESSILSSAFDSININMQDDLRTELASGNKDLQSFVDGWKPGLSKGMKKQDYISAMFSLSQELATICFRLQDLEANSQIMALLSYADKSNKIEVIRDAYQKMVDLKTELENRIEETTD